jgi:hypothetical protein
MFASAVNQRQQAFGGNEQIQNIALGTMAASFVSRLQPPNPYGQAGAFLTPPGLDLSPLVERGDAVLLAWAPDYALVKPLNKFSPRRSHRDTLLRVAAPVKMTHDQ